MITQLYLVRHGKTDWNVSKKLQGWRDVPLNNTGELEAQNVADLLKNSVIDEIYTSPLSRAYCTAKKIAAVHKIPLKIENDLKEGNFGIFEGLTWGEVMSHHLIINRDELYNRYLDRTGGGESIHDVYLRTSLVLDRIITDSVNKTIVIVSHGLAIKTLLFHAGLISRENIEHLEIKNAYPYQISYDHRNKKYTPIIVPELNNND